MNYQQAVEFAVQHFDATPCGKGWEGTKPPGCKRKSKGEGKKTPKSGDDGKKGSAPTSMFDVKMKRGDLGGAIDHSILEAEKAQDMAKQGVRSLQRKQRKLERTSQAVLDKYPLIPDKKAKALPESKSRSARKETGSSKPKAFLDDLAKDPKMKEGISLLMKGASDKKVLQALGVDRNEGIKLIRDISQKSAQSQNRRLGNGLKRFTNNGTYHITLS